MATEGKKKSRWKILLFSMVVVLYSVFKSKVNLFFNHLKLREELPFCDQFSMESKQTSVHKSR